MAEELLFQIVVIACAGIFSQWLAWKLGVPAILFLLAFGFYLGPVSGTVHPEELFGDLLQPAISAAVAVILFEGALHLKFRDLKEIHRPVKRLVLVGAPLAWALNSMGAHWIAGLEWAVAITLGGILVVTGPTVIMPMLRQARLSMNVGSLLKWEGIIYDPLGVIFAVLAYEYFIAANEHRALHEAGFFMEKVSVAVMVSLAAFGFAYVIRRIFQRGHVPEYLKAPALLAAILLIFFISNHFLHESGLIAVTVLGITLTNIHKGSFEEIHRFKETITLLLVSGVFLLLTAELEVGSLNGVNWRYLLFVAAILFLFRPLAVWLSLAGTEISTREKILVGWIAPRGIVCAAIAGLLGPLLAEAGFADGARILPVAFLVVAVTVVAHSLTIRPLSRRLGLGTKEENGIMIVGANPWIIQFAQVLKKHEVPVIVVDNNYPMLDEIEHADVPIYYGEILSEEAGYALDFHRYSCLIAATWNPSYNALVCEKMAHDFGQESVFLVATHDKNETAEHQRISPAIVGRSWGRKDLTLEKLNTLTSRGWEFRIEEVTSEKETGKLILPEESNELCILGVINKSGKVDFINPVGKETLQINEEDRIILFRKDEDYGDA